jgi:hypothetical protein
LKDLIDSIERGSAQFCQSVRHVIDIEGNVAALGGARHARAGFRALRDEHHEEAMRAESRCPTATAETASVRPKRSKEMRRVGTFSGIWTRADVSEIGGGRIVVTRGRRWFLWCNLAYCALGKPAKDYGEQGRQRPAVEGRLQHRCPRSNTWHRPKLFDRVRDRSVRTQCTSLSHGGARAPEKKRIPLSEDKTASTVTVRARGPKRAERVHRWGLRRERHRQRDGHCRT